LVGTPRCFIRLTALSSNPGIIVSYML
jgi:hypothetical protein